MGSIWEPPTPVGADAKIDTPHDAWPQSVPETSVDARLRGTAAGPLLTQAGRGVFDGVPLGTTRHAQEQAFIDQYRFRPQWYARLRAATRAALGR